MASELMSAARVWRAVRRLRAEQAQRRCRVCDRTLKPGEDSAYVVSQRVNEDGTLTQRVGVLCADHKDSW